MLVTSQGLLFCNILAWQQQISCAESSPRGEGTTQTTLEAPKVDNIPSREP